MRTTVVIKKYGNRRLYDTQQSRYVTLDEVAAVVRGGSDVQVLDAGSGADLTQATLAQIIIESGSAEHLLPAPLLTQLIRLQDPAIATLLGQWLSQALEAYLGSQSVAQALTPLIPGATSPWAATHALARMMVAGFGMPGFGMPGFGFGPGPVVAPAPPPAAQDDEVAELRREVDALRKDIQGFEPPPARPRRRR